MQQHIVYYIYYIWSHINYSKRTPGRNPLADTHTHTQMFCVDGRGEEPDQTRPGENIRPVDVFSKTCVGGGDD